MSDTATPSAPTAAPAPAAEAAPKATPISEAIANVEAKLEKPAPTKEEAPATKETKAETTEDKKTPEESVADATKAVAEGEKPTEQQLKDAEKVIKKYKIKVDGQELEVDEDELLKGYQKGRGAQKKFDEAAKYRKQAEQAFDLLKTQPAKALSGLGHDVRKFAEEYLAGELEKELMSPEQRENMELKRKLAEREEADKAVEMAKREEEASKLRNAEIQDIDLKIGKILSTSGLPKTPKTVAMVASYMNDAMDLGYKDVQPDDVIDLVRNDYNNLLKDILGATDGDTLVKLVGEDTINKIRKYDLARVKAKTPATPTSTQSTPHQEVQEEKPQPKKSTSDFLDELRNRYK